MLGFIPVPIYTYIGHHVDGNVATKPIDAAGCHFAYAVDGARWQGTLAYEGYTWLMPDLKEGFKTQMGPIFDEEEYDKLSFNTAYNYADAIYSQRFAAIE